MNLTLADSRSTRMAKYEGRWKTGLVEVEDGIAWVTLNRPDKRNAIEFIPIKRQVPTEPGNPVLRCQYRKFLSPMGSEAW
jgi:hypothetical protein